MLQLPALGEKIERMTYQEAKARLPKRTLPGFWISDVKGLAARWDKLKRGHVTTIATTPGGRPVHLIAYGLKEEVPRLANFNSAIGAREPSAYMDKAARKRPVVYFVGPVHGQEVEGLTGLVNFIEIMETGRDLRGRDQPRLRALGDACRLLIVPAGNPDGIARYEPRAAKGLAAEDSSFWSMGTWRDDTIVYWPKSKRHHPRTSANSAYIGAYFNDKGVNPMHDEFFAPMSAEAPAILRVAMDEGPDLAVSLHSYSIAPGILRPAYVPLEIQEATLSLTTQYYALLEQRGLPHAKAFTPGPERGEHPAPFNLTSALYHVSGAVSFTHECPHGHDRKKACKVTFEQILDMELTLYEAMCQFALERKQKGS
jgi:hypothetical protein